MERKGGVRKVRGSEEKESVERIGEAIARRDEAVRGVGI